MDAAYSQIDSTDMPPFWNQSEDCVARYNCRYCKRHLHKIVRDDTCVCSFSPQLHKPGFTSKMTMCEYQHRRWYIWPLNANLNTFCTKIYVKSDRYIIWYILILLYSNTEWVVIASKTSNTKTEYKVYFSVGEYKNITKYNNFMHTYANN